MELFNIEEILAGGGVVEITTPGNVGFEITEYNLNRGAPETNGERLNTTKEVF